MPRRRKALYLNLLASKSCEQTVALGNKSETIYFLREVILVLYLHYLTLRSSADVSIVDHRANLLAL